MSSTAARVIPMPTRPPTYRESITAKGNWTAVPMPILRHMIDAWYERRADKEKAPTWIAEAECIYWSDAGEIKPVRYYMKRWRWGSGKVHEFLTERGLNREPKGGTQTERKRNDRGTIIEETISESPQTGTQTEHDRNASGTVLPDSEGLKHVGETRASASPPPTPPPKPIDPWNPHHAPPDLEAVIGHGAKIGVGKDDAEEFFHHYTAAGWRAGNGNAIAHWGSKLKSWSLDTKRKGSGNGTANQRPGGKPQTSYERRMDPHLPEKVRANRELFRRANGLDDGDGGLPPERRIG